MKYEQLILAISYTVSHFGLLAFVQGFVHGLLTSPDVYTDGAQYPD